MCTVRINDSALGIGESTLGENLEVTTGAQVVGNGNVKRSFDGPTSSNNLEGRLFEIASADMEDECQRRELSLQLWRPQLSQRESRRGKCQS